MIMICIKQALLLCGHFLKAAGIVSGRRRIETNLDILIPRDVIFNQRRRSLRFRRIHKNRQPLLIGVRKTE